jgi:hypothetical protein
MIVAVGLGIALSFVLTIAGEYVVANRMNNFFLEAGVLCPMIALAVGACIGFVLKNRARIAAS